MMKAQNKSETNHFGGHNHGAKNGLNTNEQVGDEFRDVQRFCDDFLVTYLLMNCSNNLKNTHTQGKGKSPLHAVNFIPSSSGEEKKKTILVQVVTRAQTLLWEETTQEPIVEEKKKQKQLLKITQIILNLHETIKKTRTSKIC